jgi:hypothetical protein
LKYNTLLGYFAGESKKEYFGNFPKCNTLLGYFGFYAILEREKLAFLLPSVK